MATIAYNTGRQDVQQVFRATGGGVDFSANLVGTAFDYFLDSPTVDDAIYFFTNNYNVNAGLEIDPQVAMAGTDIVLVWEYYAGYAGEVWREIPDLTDNTNDLTTTGANLMVDYPRPPFAGRIDLNGVNYQAPIRCRLVSFSAVTEGGQNTSDTPQFATGRITISGTTAGTPTSLSVIYDYMNANHPEVGFDYLDAGRKEWTAGSAMIETNAVNGFLKMSNETLKYGNGSTMHYLYVAGLQVGDKVGDDKFRNLCTIALASNVGGNFWSSSSVETKIYGLNIVRGTYKKNIGGTDYAITGVAYFGPTFGEYIGVSVDVGGGGYWTGAGLTLKNCFMHQSPCVTYSFVTGQTFENVSVYYHTAAHGLLAIYGGSDTTGELEGFKWFLTSASSLFKIQVNVGSTVKLNFLNPSPALPALDGTPRYMRTDSGYPLNTNWHIYERYSFDLKVVDSDGVGVEGVTVAIIDKDGSAVTGSPFTTDGSGDITQAKCLKSHGYSDGSSVIKDEYNPYTVTISKAGLTTRTIKYTMDEKRTEIEMLEVWDITPPVFAGLTSATNCETSGEVELAWDTASDPGTGVAGYNIYYHTENDAAAIIAQGVRQVASVGATGAVVGGLTDGTLYYFIVRAYDAECPSNEDTNEVIENAKPSPTTPVEEVITCNVVEDAITGNIVEDEIVGDMSD